MSPPIPLVMRIVILFDWRMEYFCVSLSPKIFILKSIGGQIILNSHWLLKDEEAIDWKGGFRSFHWTRGISSRKGYGGLPREKRLSWVGEREKEEKECVKKRLVLMCGKVFMKKMCARNKHGRISMTKPFEFYFK
jgi:hypothetical protein